MSQEASHGAQPGPALRDEAGTQGSERGWELFPAQCGRQPSQLLAPRHGLPRAPGACYGQQTRGLHNDPKAPGRVTSAPTPSKPEKRVWAPVPTKMSSRLLLRGRQTRQTFQMPPLGFVPVYFREGPFRGPQWQETRGPVRGGGPGPSALPCGCRLGHTSCEGRSSRCHSTPQSWAGSLQKRLRGLARILQAHLLEPPIASIAPGLKWETNSTLWCPVADHTVKQSHCNNF